MKPGPLSNKRSDKMLAYPEVKVAGGQVAYLDGIHTEGYCCSGRLYTFVVPSHTGELERVVGES